MVQGDTPVTVTPQGPPAPAAITPPTFNQKQAAGKAPSNTPAGQFDIMKADYATLTPEQKAQRTQANVEKAKQKATSMGMAEEMPAMPVSAPVFASGGKRSNPAPVATRQPSFGNRAGTGATRMPI
jgi:hypothetical protein